MSWNIKMLKSSLGKKPIMALTGLCFCLFLVIHLIGNLTIYRGESTFNTYVSSLHSIEPILTIIEFGLLICGILHITTALILFITNRRARPIKYTVRKKLSFNLIKSTTMPYTGIAIFIFILVHLFNFHFSNKTNSSTFSIIYNTFSNSNYVYFYIVCIIIAGIHISHGFWSSFQTVGLDHAKYTPLIKTLGLIFSLTIILGFALIPIYISFN